MGLNGIGVMPDDWREALGWHPGNPVLADLDERVAKARTVGDVFPPASEVFAALHLTPSAGLRAVILGQDPYHGLGQAHGLAFSVRDDYQPLPPSLRNIRRELKLDLGIEAPTSGSLTPWARNGVLLLNSILTVSRGKPGSHRSFGWERVTSAVLELVASRKQPVAFLLWGRFAQDLAMAVDAERHVVIKTSHPSPLSQRGFLEQRPFSRANEGLIARGQQPVDWSLG
jgi:uracil-DNA glycosylase